MTKPSFFDRTYSYCPHSLLQVACGVLEPWPEFCFELRICVKLQEHEPSLEEAFVHRTHFASQSSGSYGFRTA
jgi:hypothetical protein